MAAISTNFPTGSTLEVEKMHTPSNVLPVTSHSQTRDTISKAEQPTNTLIYSSRSTIMLADAEVPLFDLDAIDKMEGEERTSWVKKFAAGLEEVGFVAVKAEALTLLIDGVHAVMEKYFSQPLQVKMHDWNEDNSIGFSNKGRETAAGNNVADLKETFFVPPNFDKWPTGVPEFKDTMEPYCQRLTEIAIQVMKFITESLDEPTADVASCMKTAYNLLRLAYYPAPGNNDDPQAVWAAAHEDLNAITLLPPSNVPGLQLLTKKGEWKAVNVPRGYLIVNTGEQLERKTAGFIRATRHQVLNPGGDYARQNRYASIFFASWPPEFSLKPFGSCKERVMRRADIADKESYLSRFTDVTVLENLHSRLIEMGTMKNPSEALIVQLRNKGLLQKPPQELLYKYPAYFDK